MNKINANIVGYNSREHLEECLRSLLAQDYPNLEITFIDNNSSDGSESFVRENFPEVRIIQTGRNTYYAGGHNIGIKETNGEFISFVNPDVKLEANYYSELVKPMVSDPKIAGAQGKLLRPNSKIIDSTGIFFNTSRRPFDRGQNIEDNGQFETSGQIFAANGAAPLYRRTALQDVSIEGEILDEDIAMYWDDIDLGWRLNSLGWKVWYQPTAVGFHGRAAGASPGGYRKPWQFIKHRKKISLLAQKMSLKNNILVFIKNDYGWLLWKHLPLMIFRQALIFGYSVFLQPRVLSVIPTLLKQIPRAWRKRKIVARRRQVDLDYMSQWFVKRTWSN